MISKQKKMQIGLSGILIFLLFSVVGPATQVFSQNNYDSSTLSPVDMDFETGKDRFWKAAENGLSCAGCHVEGEKDFSQDLKGAATTFPKFYAPAGKLMNLDMVINNCLETRMESKPNKLGKPASNQLTLYTKSLSNGMPIDITVAHEDEKNALEMGKKLYGKKIGQLNMACSDCHVKYPAHMIRGNGPLNDGTTPASYYPKYRTKANKLFTLQNRFGGCNRQIRATPQKVGSPAYLFVEYFLTWKAQGQEINVPGYGF